MPYVIFDTETTGLPDWKLPADHPDQPRLASAAFLLADDDFNVTEEFYSLVKPDGWQMSEEAMRVTGITMEKLNDEGRPVRELLDFYAAAIDAGRISCAHNHQFDGKMMRGELRRAGMNDKFEQTPTICTMRSMTNICKIPPKGNRGGYKWPTLSEALVFIHAENLGDHSAINDARGVAELLRYLHKTGQMPDAKVNYAKNRPEGPSPAIAEVHGDQGHGTMGKR